MAIVDICDSSNALKELQKSFSDRKIILINADVTNKGSVESAFKEVLKEFISIDIVIGSAGILNEKNYEQMIQVNLVNINL